MWCPEDHHDQLPLHSFQQIPRATTPPGSTGRQSLRPQPASSPRPDANAACGRRTTGGAWRNRRRSHRRPRRTVSLAARCGKAIFLEPASTSEPAEARRRIASRAIWCARRRAGSEKSPPTKACRRRQNCPVWSQPEGLSFAPRCAAPRPALLFVARRFAIAKHNHC
jgi:hypothetical protein